VLSIREGFCPQYSLTGVRINTSMKNTIANRLLTCTIFIAPLALQALGAPPSIQVGGVVSASAFGQFKSIAPGSWIEIYGANLASDTRIWGAADFNGSTAPTSLDGTSVTIGGQQAFVDYISPTQVNVQVASSTPTGTQSVIVTSPGGVSTPYPVTVSTTQPGLLAPTSFSVAGTQYAAALFSDGATYALPPGAIPGLASRRAQPGDTLTLYGIGFGSVSPNIPAGQVARESNTLGQAFQVMIGGTSATVQYEGLAPGAVGLYQFNVVVPNLPGSDATPLTFTLGGVAGTQTLYLAVQDTSVAPAVELLTLSAASVAGGGTVQGTVTLNGPAPAGGAVVSLSSSASAATVPTTVTVPAGANSATFAISTTAVSAGVSATITASYGGANATAALNVTIAGPFGQYGTIDIDNPTVTSGSPSGVYISLIDIAGLAFGGSGNYVGGGIVGGIYGPSGTLLLPALQFNAQWSSVVIDGQTATFTGLLEGVMQASTGASGFIATATLVVTYTPGSSAASGTATGSYNFVSSIRTISGTFSGTYSAY
jgi:uncharacterized protein (TIGR03437 family)